MILSYLTIAGLFFLIFYGLCRKILFRRKIQQYYPQSKVFWREIRIGIVTSVIFSIVSLLCFNSMFITTHSANYLFGSYFNHWFYIPFFYLVMLLLHDTYFYWTHRMMHHRLLFRWVHLTHHRSTSPSPWAAFSFSPFEAFIQVGIVPLFLLIIPLSSMHINIFFIFSLVYNVYGHLGFELFPRKFTQHWLGRWINTAVHHDLHHQESKRGFGIYLMVWDRLMGTICHQYHQRYNEVTLRDRSLVG